MVAVMEDPDAQNSEKPAGPTRRTPPYISYTTFRNVLGNFREIGIPPSIDKSAFPTLSGGVQSQVLLALRSLGLIDGEDKPTVRLQEIVAAFETDAYADALEVILRDVYPYIFKLDLMTATPGMFAEAFKNNLTAKEEVLRKCRTFFLNAAKDTEIKIGERIEKASFPRRRTSSSRKSRTKNGGDKDNTPPDPSDRQPPSSGSVVEKLLTKFPDFDPEWPDEIKKKWFEGFERFMSGAGVDAGGPKE